MSEKMTREELKRWTEDVLHERAPRAAIFALLAERDELATKVEEYLEIILQRDIATAEIIHKLEAAEAERDRYKDRLSDPELSCWVCSGSGCELQGLCGHHAHMEITRRDLQLSQLRAALENALNGLADVAIGKRTGKRNEPNDGVWLQLFDAYFEDYLEPLISDCRAALHTEQRQEIKYSELAQHPDGPAVYDEQRGESGKIESDGGGTAVPGRDSGKGDGVAGGSLAAALYLERRQGESGYPFCPEHGCDFPCAACTVAPTAPACLPTAMQRLLEDVDWEHVVSRLDAGGSARALCEILSPLLGYDLAAAVRTMRTAEGADKLAYKEDAPVAAKLSGLRIEDLTTPDQRAESDRVLAEMARARRSAEVASRDIVIGAGTADPIPRPTRASLHAATEERLTVGPAALTHCGVRVTGGATAWKCERCGYGEIAELSEPTDEERAREWITGGPTPEGHQAAFVRGAGAQLGQEVETAECTCASGDEWDLIARLGRNNATLVARNEQLRSDLESAQREAHEWSEQAEDFEGKATEWAGKFRDAERDLQAARQRIEDLEDGAAQKLGASGADERQIGVVHRRVAQVRRQQGVRVRRRVESSRKIGGRRPLIYPLIQAVPRRQFPVTL